MYNITIMYVRYSTGRKIKYFIVYRLDICGNAEVAPEQTRYSQWGTVRPRLLPPLPIGGSHLHRPHAGQSLIHGVMKKEGDQQKGRR